MLFWLKEEGKSTDKTSTLEFCPVCSVKSYHTIHCVSLKQERMPEEGEAYFADTVNYCSGGKGANQAVQAAKLGVATYIAGCIGTDPVLPGRMFDKIIQTMKGYNISYEVLVLNNNWKIIVSSHGGHINSFLVPVQA